MVLFLQPLLYAFQSHDGQESLPQVSISCVGSLTMKFSFPFMFLYQEISFSSKYCFLVFSIQELSSKALMKGTLVFLKLHCSSLQPNLSPERLSSIFPKPTIMDSPSIETSCVSWLSSYSFFPSSPKWEFNFIVNREEQRYPSPASSGPTQ